MRAGRTSPSLLMPFANWRYSQGMFMKPRRWRAILSLVAILGGYLFCADAANAQMLPIPPASRDIPEPAIPIRVSPVHALFEPIDGYMDDFRFWIRMDYLLGWVRQAPGNLPLVTSGDPKNKIPGAIGQPGTTVLFGNAGIGFRLASGGRFVLGAWIDSANVFGIEGGGYVLERRANNFIQPFDDKSKLVVAIPFVNQTSDPAAEAAHLVANPKKIAGDVLIASSMQRWGAELNGIYCFWRRPGFELSVLTGLRYEDLQESMRILQHSLGAATKSETSFDDQFKTGNQFFGGQVGLRLHWQHDTWVFDVTSKVAVGSTHQVVEIMGDSSQFGSKALPVGSFPSGLFAQSSNIGRSTANPIVAIPSLEGKIGYQVTPGFRVFTGYDILYWNQVVRPGDQIDRNINLSQSPVLGATNGVLSGAAQPSSLFQRRGFWAQNVSIGMEFRF
jgi:hypothetical protein